MNLKNIARLASSISALIIGTSTYFFAGNLANAAEVSFVSGGLRSASVESNGGGEIDSTEIGAGGRYLENMDQETAVFFYGYLNLINYDGDNAPSDSIGLSIGAGQRFSGYEFSPRIVPFVNGYVEFETMERLLEGFGRVEESTALNYGVALGLKFDMLEVAFFEIETDIFKSALMKTAETSDLDGGNKTETSSFELYASTAKESVFQSIKLSLGMRL